MKHLQVYRGIPVPWVVANGQGRHEFEPCQWSASGCDLELVWRPNKPHEFRPDHGKYDDARLRECMAGEFCHVCQAKTPDLLLVVPKGVKSLAQIRVGPDYVPMVKQPWVCPGCLAFSVRYCPPLSAAMESRTAVAFEVKDYRLISTTYQPVNEGDPVPPAGKSVLSYFQAALTDFRLQMLHEWNASTGRHVRKRMRLGGV